MRSGRQDRLERQKQREEAKRRREKEREAQRRKLERARLAEDRKRRRESRGGWLGLAKETWRGIAYGAGGLFAMIGIGVAAYLLQPEEYDRKTLCFYRASPQRTMILIDRSDVLIGADTTRALIRSAADELPIGGRLTVFEIGPRGTITDPLFDLCYPGRGDDVSELYRNKRLVEAFYLRQFEAPLQEKVLDRLSVEVSSDRSPIAESIAEMFRLSRREPGADRVRIIIVSDFLQFTDAFGDAYSGRFPVEKATDMLSLAQQDQIVEIEAVVMRRDQHLESQDAARRAYWDPIFKELRIFVDWK